MSPRLAQHWPAEAGTRLWSELPSDGLANATAVANRRNSQSRFQVVSGRCRHSKDSRTRSLSVAAGLSSWNHRG